jgi:hypothetical protein
LLSKEKNKNWRLVILSTDYFVKQQTLHLFAGVCVWGGGWGGVGGGVEDKISGWVIKFSQKYIYRIDS